MATGEASAQAIEARINDAIMEVWYRPALGLETSRPRMPMVYPQLVAGGLLVVGLNPSFSEVGFRSFLRGPEWASFDPMEFYRWRSGPGDYVAKAQRIEEASLQAHAYFRPFEAFAASVGRPWQHLDLLAVRETSDKVALEWVGCAEKREPILPSLNAFGRAQVEVSVRAIGLIQPECLIVPNVTAARILVETLRATFDDERGCYLASVGEKQVPMFCSSMWTGQRALDRFSRELLEWHLKRSISG